MATIHLAGSIVLFLFGGVITLVGIGTMANPFYNGIIFGLSGFYLFVVGVFMIVIGVFVAMMSKSK